MSVTVITEDRSGTSQEQSSTTETMEAEAIEEVAEIVADTSLEIAQTEAARDIAIAEIHAETAIELATAEAQTREDEQWLRERLASTEAENSTLREQVELLTASLALSASTPEPIVEPEIVAETISLSTPNDTSELIEQMPMEVIAESASESQAETVKVELPPLLEVKRRPTIRLV